MALCVYSLSPIPRESENIQERLCVKAIGTTRFLPLSIKLQSGFLLDTVPQSTNQYNLGPLVHTNLDLSIE
jgi:hypothetical protein